MEAAGAFSSLLFTSVWNRLFRHYGRRRDFQWVARNA